MCGGLLLALYSPLTLTPNPCCPREEVERALDERQYEEEVQLEVMEQETESEELYQKKLSAYSKQLEEWRVWRRQQVGGLQTLDHEGWGQTSKDCLTGSLLSSTVPLLSLLSSTVHSCVSTV